MAAPSLTRATVATDPPPSLKSSAMVAGGFNTCAELEEKLAKALQTKPADLESISKIVAENKERNLFLPNNLFLRICDLNGTVYMGQDYMLESWERLYSPRKTNMVVLGAVDNCLSLAPGMQLVVLVAEDGRVYVYEDEELHKAADSWQEFSSKGFTSTGETYYRYTSSQSPGGSDESKETLPEVLEIRREAQEFVDKNAAKLMQLLNKL